MKRRQSIFSKNIERNLVWLIRGILVLCHLCGAFFVLSCVYYILDCIPYAVMMFCAGIAGWVFVWHANKSLKNILEYEGKIEFFLKFANEVLKPMKELEDAKKDVES